jgi:hypothetical protein
MFSGKTKSIKYVIEKVFRDTGVVEGIDVYDCVEWSAECLELIGAPQAFEEKVGTIDIVDYRGKLPCDLFLIIQSRVRDTVDDAGKTSIVYQAMRYATDTFHRARHENKAPDLKIRAAFTYSLSDDCIFTNFPQGTVQLAYKGFATDENGWPKIPDDIKFVKAIEYYLREKIDYRLLRAGKIQERIWMETQRESLYYIGAAQNRANLPSIDEMENIKNNFTRLMPRNQQHDDFFSTLGEPEARNISTNVSRNGWIGDNVDGKNYFTDLENNNNIEEI